MPYEEFIFRKATKYDHQNIWKILQEAIKRRKLDKSNQWQDGYPNENTIHSDIAHNYAWVLVNDKDIAAYIAIITEIEPAYEAIEGNWLTHGKYFAIHRVAVSDQFIGKGLATQLFLYAEDIAKSNQIYSIKVDTNFDNVPTLRILEKLNYTYCGEVYFRGSPRKAYEKTLS